MTGGRSPPISAPSNSVSTPHWRTYRKRQNRSCRGPADEPAREFTCTPRPAAIYRSGRGRRRSGVERMGGLREPATIFPLLPAGLSLLARPHARLPGDPDGALLSRRGVGGDPAPSVGVRHAHTAADGR